MKNFCLITLFICFSGLPVWGGGTSEKAVYDLIERVTPGYASQYRLEMIQPENGSDVYEVDGDGQRIILRGNNAVSLATAFNWYLKYTLHELLHGKLYCGVVELGTLATRTGLHGDECYQYAFVFCRAGWCMV